MIENAIQLAEEENADCCFQVMDAENPMFADETFDVVISRNLTWTLPNAEHAYGEWMRVLKTGGVLLNFDANYGKEDVADTKGLPEAHAHFKVGNEMLEECERIKSQLPISRKNGRRTMWRCCAKTQREKSALIRALENAFIWKKTSSITRHRCFRFVP